MATQRYRMEMTWVCPSSVYYIYYSASDGNANGIFNITKGDASSRNSEIANFLSYIDPNGGNYSYPGYSNYSLSITENGNNIHFVFEYDWDLSADPRYFIGYFVVNFGHISGEYPTAIPVPVFATETSTVQEESGYVFPEIKDIEISMVDQIYKLLLSQRNGVGCTGKLSAKIELAVDMINAVANYKTPGITYDGIVWQSSYNCLTEDEVKSLIQKIKAWLNIADCPGEPVQSNGNPLAGLGGTYLTTTSGDFITTIGGAYFQVT